MCCLKPQKRVKRKYGKKGIIYPKNYEPKKVVYPEPFNINRRNAVDPEFIDKFVKEVIYCGGCKQPFNLGSNELKIHCNLCDKFFHCKIAGECQGDNCTITKSNGEIHRASYCYDCMGLVTDTNKLCKDCFMDDYLSKTI
jgi:hypothetical protein